MFGPARVELGLILKLEQKLQRTAQPELLVQAALNGRFHGLAAPRMAAAAVRPVERPQPFAGRSLLQEQLTPVIEDQQRKCPVQNALAIVAQILVQKSDFSVGPVYENQRVNIS
jgi:hypothetical protein